MIKKYGIYLLVIALLLIASLMIYKKLNPQKLPANLISATGKVDGDLITLNTKYPGRIGAMKIQDGQSIKKDEVVAQLTSKEYHEKLKALNAEIEAAKNELKAMQDELSLAATTIALSIQKAKDAVAIAKDQTKQAQSAVTGMHAVVMQNKRDLIRAKVLYEKHLIAKQKLELATLQHTTNSQKLQALKAEYKTAQKAVTVAKSNYKIALAQNKKIAALTAKTAATQEKVKALIANRSQLQTIINELSIKSPINGFVVEKIANIGEVLDSGMIVATLIDPDSFYLKVFIDTIKNGKIKIGDKAVIFLDAYPNKPIAATVVNIAANAEFTPKEVAVRSDRIQKVFAVHLKPNRVDPLLKLGIPAVGVISVDGKGLPRSLHDIPTI